MQAKIKIVSPGKNGSLIGENGESLYPPSNWAFLKAGDAGLTRKVTAQGEYWRVQFKKGRRTISTGLWAPAIIIEQAQKDVASVRQTDAYQKKRASDIVRRERKQESYESEFCLEVEKYLGFHPSWKKLEKTLAKAVTVHAIPVGSGTVARTQMIPVQERAARAVIAWLRHHTTAYDNLQIARIKGERRTVRRQLAQQSVTLLDRYREGKNQDPACPLQHAIAKWISKNNS